MAVEDCIGGFLCFRPLDRKPFPSAIKKGCCALLGELQDVLRGKETRDGWNSNPCRTQTYSKEVNTIRGVFWYMQHVATGNLLFETFWRLYHFAYFAPFEGVATWAGRPWNWSCAYGGGHGCQVALVLWISAHPSNFTISMAMNSPGGYRLIQSNPYSIQH